MTETWNSIEAILASIAPKIKESLNKGASEQELGELQTIINAKLPIDLIDFYKIHNGQNSDSPGLMYSEELLSLERILSEWKIWKNLLDSKTFEENNEPFTSEPALGIKNDWWNPLWIPITYDGSGNHYCIDLDPVEGGNYGQIIRMWHDDAARSLEANSFKEWISEFNDKLKSGQLIYSEDYFGIIDKDDL